MVLEFARRPGSYSQESLEFPVATLAATFRNVRGNRNCRPPDLTSHPKHFLLRKAGCNLVRIESQLCALCHTCKSLKSFIAATPSLAECRVLIAECYPSPPVGVVTDVTRL